MNRKELEKKLSHEIIGLYCPPDIRGRTSARNTWSWKPKYSEEMMGAPWEKRKFLFGFPNTLLSETGAE